MVNSFPGVQPRYFTSRRCQDVTKLARYYVNRWKKRIVASQRKDPSNIGHRTCAKDSKLIYKQYSVTDSNLDKQATTSNDQYVHEYTEHRHLFRQHTTYCGNILVEIRDQ